MEAQDCPECGARAFKGWEDTSPKCPNGHGEITEEGLVSKTIINLDGSKTYATIGKDGGVICCGANHSEQITALLETILRTEEPARSDMGIFDFVQASTRKWNRKRANRLFGRWLKESDNNLPAIRDGRLRDLADRLIRDAQNQVEGSSGWTMEDLDRWSSRGFLYELKLYEIRRDREPALLVRGEVPETVTQAFRQAKECYRWGLYGASFGLFRIVLDIVVTLIDELKRDASWPQPVREDFKPLLSCIPNDLLSDREKTWAAGFWTHSSNFLHGRGPLPGEDDAWAALQATATILDRLAGREAFRQK